MDEEEGEVEEEEGKEDRRRRREGGGGEGGGESVGVGEDTRVCTCMHTHMQTGTKVY